MLEVIEQLLRLTAAVGYPGRHGWGRCLVLCRKLSSGIRIGIFSAREKGTRCGGPQ
jgi:hypothetical protein